MPVLRADIERALEDLKSNESGMKFQGLAVILARLRYPEFIACERKKDFGADALIRSKAAVDGVGRAMASSITPTLKKITEDATDTKKAYDDISFLMFITTEKVGNTLVRDWTVELKKSYDYDLVVISREDVITTLMMPENSDLCGSFLGIHIPYEPSVAEISVKVEEAVGEDLAKWSQRLLGKPLIDLTMFKLDSAEQEFDHPLLLADLLALLNTGHRAILEAPAGRGKTTQLIRLASEQSKSPGMFFLIDFPAWVRSKRPILEYVAHSTAFQSRSITAEQLAQVSRVRQCIFLLNGWNEVDQTDNTDATNALKTIEREFPKSGMLIATRAHYLKPPLPGAIHLRLAAVTSKQRRKYLTERLDKRAGELRAKVESEPALNELTRNPMILAEVTTIFEANKEIPTTKMLILDAILALMEQSDEHRNFLEAAPLSGRSRNYLTALAQPMIANGGIYLEDESARKIVADTARDLVACGQIGTIPEPITILGSLTAHHSLERSEYPKVAFRFQHQQFQEFYGAHVVRNRLATLDENDSTARFEFIKEFINNPAWEESILMLAEHIGSNQPDPILSDRFKSGKLLVLMSLEVDPVFAAHLSRLCGQEVWQLVRSEVGECLRYWHANPNAQHKRCAMTAILATGSSDFSDLVVPLLSHSDQQVRLTTYRAIDHFNLSTLGADWHETIQTWPQDVKEDLVTEILRNGNNSDIVSYVMSQSNMEIKKEAATSLWWIGMEEDASRLFSTLPDSIATELLLAYAPEMLTPEMKERAIALLKNHISSQTDPIKKLSALLTLSQTYNDDCTEEIKATLKDLPFSRQHHLDHLIGEAATAIAQRDTSWTSNWIAEQISSGTLWHEHWLPRITSLSSNIKEKLLNDLEQKDLKHNDRRTIGILTKVADQAIVQRVLTRLQEIKSKIIDSSQKLSPLEYSIFRQLVKYLREIPIDTLVTAIAPNLEKDADELLIINLSEVLRTDGYNFSNYKVTLPGDSGQKLREYYRKGLPQILARQDYSGGEKANFVNALGCFGEAGDLDLMEAVIQADRERVRIGREAYAKGDRTALGHGSYYGHARAYIRAITQVTTSKHDTLLIKLLDDQWYEGEVAAYMESQMGLQKTKESFGGFIDYQKIPAIREGKIAFQINEERRKKFSSALSSKISTLLDERKNSKNPASLDYRLERMTSVLAAIDAEGSLSLILEVINLPRERNHDSIIYIIENLFFSGVTLSASQLSDLLRPVFDEAKSNGYHDQNNLFNLKRALCLFLFATPASEGILRLRELLAELKFYSYELRDIITAAGESGSPDAVGFICESAQDPNMAKSLGDEPIRALIKIDAPDARNALISLLDPAITPAIPRSIAHERDQHLINRLVKFAIQDLDVKKRLFELCNTDLSSDRRVLLAAVLRAMRTSDSTVAALSLLNDEAHPALPYPTFEQFEDIFLERREVAPGSSTYTLEPRQATDLRARIFDLSQNDPQRKRTAYGLLGHIEEWRLDHGKPLNEPRHPNIDSKLKWP